MINASHNCEHDGPSKDDSRVPVALGGGTAAARTAVAAAHFDGGLICFGELVCRVG